jgi:hypothetical protein
MLSPPGRKIDVQTVKSVGIISVAKMSGIIGTIFGVLLVPITWIMDRMVIGSSGPALSYWSPLHSLLIVVEAAVLWFVYGIVGAIVYNVVAKWMGGIEVEL